MCTLAALNGSVVDKTERDLLFEHRVYDIVYDKSAYVTHYIKYSAAAALRDEDSERHYFQSPRVRSDFARNF